MVDLMPATLDALARTSAKPVGLIAHSKAQIHIIMVAGSFSGSIRWNNTNNRTLPNRSFNGDNGSGSNQGQSVDGRRFGNGSSTRVTPTDPARTFESQPFNTRTFQGGSNRSFGGGGTVSSGSNRSFGGGGTGGGRSFGGRR